MARIAIALLLLSHSAAGAWRRVADLPFGLSDFTATVVPNFGEVEGRGRIVIVGGCDEDQVVVADPDDIWSFCPSVSNKVLLYDYAADKWSRGNNAPRARYRHAAATDGHKLYVLGGRNVDDGLVPQTDVRFRAEIKFRGAYDRRERLLSSPCELTSLLWISPYPRSHLSRYPVPY